MIRLLHLTPWILGIAMLVACSSDSLPGQDQAGPADALKDRETLLEAYAEASTPAQKREVLVQLNELRARTVAASEEVPDQTEVTRVGFDIDDTLLFSSPAFNAAKAEHPFGTDEFWAMVNRSDREHSIVKVRTREIVEEWKAAGAEVWAITARPGTEGDPVRDFISETFGIPRENVYFEKPKTERIRGLGIQIFYGDSDSDIKDAQEAGAIGIRILRSPNSSYRNKDGTLRKYHPGIHGEEIVLDSEE
jgi:acid phosphatase (class B)